MKLPIPRLSATLLVLYSVYTAFVPLSTPHSIIVFSLTAFAAFQYYIDSHKTPSLQKLVQDLREEQQKQMKADKEALDLKLAELKADQQRQAIERANASATGTAAKKPAIKF